MATEPSCLSLSQVVIPTGATGAAGANGSNGTNGSDGEFGGFSGEWVFDTATTANPAVTKLRFNNATLSSVTAIYINDTNKDSVDYNNFLETFKNTVSAVDQYGLIKVWKRFDANTFIFAKITNVVDNGADHTLTVTYISSNGTFSANDDVVVSFAPNGASSVDDPEVLFANHTPGATTAAVTSSLMSETVAANTLSTNGDSLAISIHATRTAVNKATNTIRVEIGGTNVTIGSVDWEMVAGVSALKIDINLTRVSATTAFLDVKSWFVSSTNTLSPSLANYNAAFPFIAANNNLVDIKGASANVGNTTTATQLLIKKFDI